jgi:hypothetical protein
MAGILNLRYSRVGAKDILDNKSNLSKVCLYLLTIVIIGTGTLVLTLPQNPHQESLGPISTFSNHNLIRQKSLLFEEKNSLKKGLKESLKICSLTPGFLTLPFVNSHFEAFFDIKKPSYYALFSILLPSRSPPSFLI